MDAGLDTNDVGVRVAADAFAYDSHRRLECKTSECPGGLRAVTLPGSSDHPVRRARSVAEAHQASGSPTLHQAEPRLPRDVIRCAPIGAPAEARGNRTVRGARSRTSSDPAPIRTVRGFATCGGSPSQRTGVLREQERRRLRGRRQHLLRGQGRRGGHRLRHPAEVATAGRDFVRAYAYTGLDPENENQRQFHRSWAASATRSSARTSASTATGASRRTWTSSSWWT